MAEDCTYLYCVGGEVFAITAAEHIHLSAPNMAPFRTKDAGEAERLFTLNIASAQAEYDRTSFTHFFTDTTLADAPRIEVYQSSNHWLFRLAQNREDAVCCELLTTQDFRTATLYLLPCLTSSEAPSNLLRFAVDNATMLQYAFATMHKHILEMHAAVVVHEGKAYLFLGKSGTGKSTHARQWLAQYHQAWLLNDDNPILRIDNTNRLYVYGSPWSGKTPCYRTESIPVAGIIQLEQAPHNHITLQPKPMAYAAMLASCSGMKVLHQAMDGLHDTISRIVLNTPMALLQCLPDKDAAILCHDYIAEHAST